MTSTPSPCSEAQPTSKGREWTGRILTALAALFLLLDAAGKLVAPQPVQVTQAFVRLGIPITLSNGIGLLLLVCTVVYLIPRTAVLGAVLLSGYLGGAVAIHLRAGSSTFETVFPVLFAILTWSGIYLREPRICPLLPLRR
ncbi:MAG TPA: DoxX family protein [Terracidiphilus sp.]|nr:DoxX family protein [Terracidiphilus sp.]